MKKINSGDEALPQLTIPTSCNIGFLEVKDIHSKLNIIYHPKKISGYQTNQIYPKLRTDNKCQLHLYTDTFIKMYLYNEEINLLLLRKKDWNYFIGYFINNKNEMVDTPSINVLS